MLAMCVIHHTLDYRADGRAKCVWIRANTGHREGLHRQIWIGLGKGKWPYDGNRYIAAPVVSLGIIAEAVGGLTIEAHRLSR